MSLTEALLIVLVLMSLMVLLTLAAFAFFILKYRVPIRGALGKEQHSSTKYHL